MITTLPYITQPFYVKKLASAGLTIDKIPEGELGIVDELTGKTVSALDPKKKITFVKTFNGKPLYLVDSINKNFVRNVLVKKYQKEQVQKFKATIDYCSCIKSVNLNITASGNSIYEQTGQMDAVFGFNQTSPAELDCFCNCSGQQTYANHLITFYLYKQILAMKSPYFTAKVTKESGSELTDEKAIEDFIKQNKEKNTNDDPADDSEKLSLIIEALPQANMVTSPYHRVSNGPLKIVPTISINDTVFVLFEETQKGKAEIGAGLDLMQEEWDNINFYTTANYSHQMENGMFVDDVDYQFKKDGTYDTVTLEFDTDKTYRAGTNEKKSFGLLLGTDAGNGVVDAIEALFK